MISKQDLFQGTTFNAQLQGAIYTDIVAMREWFPTIYPYQYQYPQYIAVLLQGTVQITIGGQDCPLPLSMVLPPNFPDLPPYATIPIPPGFPLKPSNGLQPNGTINTACFFQWIPRKSRLAQYVNAIIQYLSSNPPFTMADGLRLTPPKTSAPSSQGGSQYGGMQQQYPNQYQNQYSQYPNQYPQQSMPPKPQVNLAEIQEQAVVEAMSIVDDLNRKIMANEHQIMENKLVCDMADIINDVQTILNDHVSKSKEELKSLNAQPLPEVPIDPEIEQQLETRAKEETYDEVKEVLRETFLAQAITVDEYFQTVRDISKNHFRQVLLPSMSS
ncbi:hypothetical protein TRFO_37816 [Tritrichomonas foetus]|uniref:UEV domain-containing protein n=1 Tax=Tritrichomonas foetus TaxID=1144522 RepID=A0A1J4JA71_9EUKA|nr:hypothetical protein TRFO_37816 [Tritrichomonas foetus]|eukprot:OHS96064.1 hypothetical protein TRFO_37816 [Tritrichomonas foetus]